MSIWEWSWARWLVIAGILLALFATYHVIRAGAGWSEPDPGPKPWPRAAQAKILDDCELRAERCNYLLDAWMSEYSYSQLRGMTPRARWRAAEWVNYRLRTGLD